MKLAVADPVSRRYALLPPIPDDLAAPVLQQRRQHLEKFLVPANEEEEACFKVICLAVCKFHLVAFVFSSASGGWSAFPFQGWTAFTQYTGITKFWFRLSWRYCAGSCFFWRMDWTVLPVKLLVLDTSTMEFSTDDTAPGYSCESCSAIVKAGDGRPEMFTIRRDFGARKYELHSLRRQSNAENASVWKFMKKVEVKLPPHHNFIIAGAIERYLLLQGIKGEQVPLHFYRRSTSIHAKYFLLELETMRVEKVCELVDVFLHLNNLYTGFPPSLSLPSLDVPVFSSCVNLTMCTAGDHFVVQ